MLEVTDYTAVLQRGGMIERVSISRAVQAPKPKKNNETKIVEQCNAISSKKHLPRKDHTQGNNASKGKVWRCTVDSTEDRRLTIEMLMDYDEK